MVNLVVEYMDGGSLQDLVDRGGCQDEQVLADIAHQVRGGIWCTEYSIYIYRIWCTEYIVYIGSAWQTVLCMIIQI
jgi:hypothetical protein